METRITNLHRYAYEILNQLCTRANKPSLIEDSWLEMSHPDDVAAEVLKGTQGHYVGIDSNYILQPCGNPTPTRHDPTISKQFYMVHHRSSNEPTITFRVGYDVYQNLCTLLKDIGYTIENSTTVIVVSKVIYE